jgi:hypothetical protein
VRLAPSGCLSGAVEGVFRAYLWKMLPFHHPTLLRFGISNAIPSCWRSTLCSSLHRRSRLLFVASVILGRPPVVAAFSVWLGMLSLVAQLRSMPRPNRPNAVLQACHDQTRSQGGPLTLKPSSGALVPGLSVLTEGLQRQGRL